MASSLWVTASFSEFPAKSSQTRSPTRPTRALLICPDEDENDKDEPEERTPRQSTAEFVERNKNVTAGTWLHSPMRCRGHQDQQSPKCQEQKAISRPNPVPFALLRDSPVSMQCPTAPTRSVRTVCNREALPELARITSTDGTVTKSLGWPGPGCDQIRDKPFTIGWDAAIGVEIANRPMLASTTSITGRDRRSRCSCPG